MFQGLLAWGSHWADSLCPSPQALPAGTEGICTAKDRAHSEDIWLQQKLVKRQRETANAECCENFTKKSGRESSLSAPQYVLSLSRSYRVYQSTGVFLLVQRNHLGIQAFDYLIREKWSLDAALAGGRDQKCGKDEQTPEQILQHHQGPAWEP